MENPPGRFRQAPEEEKDAGDVHGGGGHAPVQAGQADCVSVAARVVPRRGRQRQRQLQRRRLVVAGRQDERVRLHVHVRPPTGRRDAAVRAVQQPHGQGVQRARRPGPVHTLFVRPAVQGGRDQLQVSVRRAACTSGVRRRLCMAGDRELRRKP